MKKILVILFASGYFLFANTLPSSISTSVSNIKEGQIHVTANVPKGMSGIIIHNYGHGLSAITHTTISLGSGQASIQEYTTMQHENIPSIKTAVTVGDKVIFGNFYNNALLIAPNQNSYNQITKSFHKNWIHPDAFALAFMQNGESSLSLENLKAFSKLNQIGLILLVDKNKVLILDPMSKKFLGALNMQINQSNPISPFYARFNQMDVSTFGLSEKSYTPYFESIAGVK